MFTLSNPDTPVFPADTFGWDSVYAIPFGTLNSVLEGQAPSTFDPITQIDDTTSDTFTLRNGNYGDWRIVPGGSGQIVCMEIDLTGFQFERTGSSPLIYDAANAKATVLLRLAALPQPIPTGALGNPDIEVMEFRVAPTNTDPVQSVTVTYDPGATPPDPLSQFNINDLMGALLNRDADDFNMVFATVNLSKKTSEAGGEGWTWLLPTHTSYAVRDVDSDNGVFAVLAMTENRQPSPIHDVSVGAIPEGQVSGFLVSERLFLEKLVLPNIGILFHDANDNNLTANDFEITSDFKITNRNTVYIPSLELDNGKVVQADIPPRQFTVTPSGDELIMRLEQFHYVYKSGIEVFADFENRSTIALEADKFTVNERSASCPRANIEKEDWLIWTEILVPIGIGIVGAVVGAGIGKALSGTGQVVAQGANAAAFEGAAALAVNVPPQAATAATGEVALNLLARTGSEAAAGTAVNIAFKGLLPSLTYRLGAALFGAIAGATMGSLVPILENIAKEPASAKPKLDKFLAPALEAVAWPTVEKFELSSAQLNKSFQLGITPVLTSAQEEAA